MRSCSLDLLLSYLCAMTESGEIVDTQLQLLLADSSSDRILVSYSFTVCTLVFFSTLL